MEERRNEFKEVINRLIELGWTKEAIADELGVTWYSLHNWQTGRKVPRAPQAILLALRGLEGTRPPKKRRYGPDAPQRRSKKEPAPGDPEPAEKPSETNQLRNVQEGTVSLPHV
jgi:hypothetical protein